MKTIWYIVISLLLAGVSGLSVAQTKQAATAEKTKETASTSEFQRKDCPQFSGRWVGQCDKLSGERSIIITQGADWCATMQVDNEKLIIGGMSSDGTANEVEASNGTNAAFWSADRKKLEIHAVFASRETTGKNRMRLGSSIHTLERKDDTLSSHYVRNTKEIEGSKVTNKTHQLNCTYKLAK